MLLLGADETAVPAVASILERLPADARGTAVLEVPAAGDFLDLAAPPGVTVRWYARGDRPHGQALTAAVRELAAALDPATGAPVGELDESDLILWDVPEAGPGRRRLLRLAGRRGHLHRGAAPAPGAGARLRPAGGRLHGLLEDRRRRRRVNLPAVRSGGAPRGRPAGCRR